MQESQIKEIEEYTNYVVDKFKKGKSFSYTAINSFATEQRINPVTLTSEIIRQAEEKGVSTDKFKRFKNSLDNFAVEVYGGKLLTKQLNKWARQNGFKNSTEYQEYVARQNGFKNYSEYKKYLVIQKGFKSIHDKRKFEKSTQFSALADSLMKHGMPKEMAIKVAEKGIKMPTKKSKQEAKKRIKTFKRARR